MFIGSPLNYCVPAGNGLFLIWRGRSSSEALIAEHLVIRSGSNVSALTLPRDLALVVAAEITGRGLKRPVAIAIKRDGASSFIPTCAIAKFTIRIVRH